MTLSLKLATPAHVSKSLLKPVSPELRSELASIVYPSLAAVALGYPDESIKHPLDGFGMLIPSLEKKQTLGALFSSTLFPNRTPKGLHLMGNWRDGISVGDCIDSCFVMAHRLITAER